MLGEVSEFDELAQVGLVEQIIARQAFITFLELAFDLGGRGLHRDAQALAGGELRLGARLRLEARGRLGGRRFGGRRRGLIKRQRQLPARGRRSARLAGESSSRRRTSFDSALTTSAMLRTPWRRSRRAVRW